MTLDRRQALFGMTSALLLPASLAASDRQRFSNEVFAHGVASGDPAADSVVLWTRISGRVGEVAVRWSVATDASMKRTIAWGAATTSEVRDHTVKGSEGRWARNGRDLVLRWPGTDDSNIIHKRSFVPKTLNVKL